ncbi:MAG: hypothetical protein EXS63_04445 [Candidatus Omnitrophica bacterium]|nr:hypothetical protein [Candidatus Omnitrophota bacterium]
MKTAAAAREIKMVLTQESEFVARTEKILPVENGAGAVIRLNDRLPSAAEIEILRLNLRNPNHREAWVILVDHSKIASSSSALLVGQRTDPSGELWRTMTSLRTTKGSEAISEQSEALLRQSEKKWNSRYPEAAED